jgi:hypothetical protein
MAAISADRIGGGTPVAGYRLTPFFGVELRRDFGRADQIAE